MAAYNVVRFRVKQGRGLGVTDPVSGELVVDIKA